MSTSLRDGGRRAPAAAAVRLMQRVGGLKDIGRRATAAAAVHPRYGLELSNVRAALLTVSSRVFDMGRALLSSTLWGVRCCRVLCVVTVVAEKAS